MVLLKLKPHPTRMLLQNDTFSLNICPPSGLIHCNNNYYVANFVRFEKEKNIE